MERKTIEQNKEQRRDYAVLVGLRSPVLGADSADEESLAELGALVETAGGEPVGTILQSREKPDPHSFIGEGKVEEVKRMVENGDATMVIFDNDLSPSQIRVLTELCGVQVLDRSGLILDIFAQRAKTKEGCLQVELAQYQYLLPRLIGMWSHLERQGGIGTPEYVFVYRIKTSDGTETYRTSRLPTPTMEGYLFDGWYTDLVGGDKIKPAEYEFQEDGQTLYAHWTPVSGESTAEPEPEAAEQPASTFRLEDHLGEILIVGTTVLVVTLVAMHG